jgi:hypothetical protein
LWVAHRFAAALVGGECMCLCICAVPPNKIVHFFTCDEATLDGIGPAKIAYQVSMSGNHGVASVGLRAAMEAVNATVDDPLRFCFVVPHEVFASPCQWSRRTISFPSDARDVVDRVEFYVVSIRGTTPETKKR